MPRRSSKIPKKKKNSLAHCCLSMVLPDSSRVACESQLLRYFPNLLGERVLLVPFRRQALHPSYYTTVSFRIRDSLGDSRNSSRMRSCMPPVSTIASNEERSRSSSLVRDESRHPREGGMSFMAALVEIEIFPNAVCENRGSEEWKCSVVDEKPSFLVK